MRLMHALGELRDWAVTSYLHFPTNYRSNFHFLRQKTETGSTVVTLSTGTRFKAS